MRSGDLMCTSIHESGNSYQLCSKLWTNRILQGDTVRRCGMDWDLGGFNGGSGIGIYRVDWEDAVRLRRRPAALIGEAYVGIPINSKNYRIE